MRTAWLVGLLAYNLCYEYIMAKSQKRKTRDWKRKQSKARKDRQKRRELHERQEVMNRLKGRDGIIWGKFMPIWQNEPEPLNLWDITNEDGTKFEGKVIEDG